MNWVTKPLKDLCTIEKGTIGITKATPGPYPLVTLGEERKEHSDHQFDAKAVIIPLVSSTGHGHASMKRIHYQEGKFAVGTILCAVIPKDDNELHVLFLYHYLDVFKEQLLVPLMRGMANVTLPMKSLGELEIPVPPIQDQLEWVEKFKSVNQKETKLLAELTHQQTLLKQLRQAILQEAVQGKLTEQWRKNHPEVEPASVLLEKIKAEKAKLTKEGKLKKQKPLPPISQNEIPFTLPEGWVWCRLEQITTKIGSGSTPRGGKEVYVTNGVPFFRSQNIHDDGLKLDDVAYISNKVHDKMSSTQVLADDILLNITGGSIGRSTLVSQSFEEGNVSQHVSIIRQIGLNSSYLHKVVLSPYVQNEIFSSTTGAGREGLPKYNLEKFLIPLPPLSEQQAIVEKVESLLAKVSQLEEEVQQNQQRAEQLLQSVLREVMQPNAAQPGAAQPNAAQPKEKVA